MSQYGGEGKMLIWLPSSHVLENPCDYSKVHGNVRNCYQKQQQTHPRFSSELQSQSPKSTSRPSYERPKHATGGPGMQAIFIGSGQRSCGGTGVFLPEKAGSKPTKKPACAPVLLPARVIEALNLKVDELGLQITPPNQGVLSKRNKSTKKKNNRKDAQYRPSSSSQDIFLPKEWTY